jgi:methyl-accepting chemotaxis protein
VPDADVWAMATTSGIGSVSRSASTARPVRTGWSRSSVSPESLLSRLTIRARLALNVGLVLMMAGLIGIVGLRSLSQVATTGAAIYDRGVVPVTSLGMIRADMKDVRIGILNYVTSTTPALKAKHKGKKEAAEAAYVKDLAAYRPHSIDPKTLQAMDDAWQTYLQALPALMVYGDQKNFDAYGRERDAHAIAPSGAADAALMKLTAEEQQAALARRQQAQRQYTSSRTQLTIFMALAMLVAVGGAVVVALSIVVPIRRMRDDLTRVTDGDLSARLDPVGSNELSELGRSIDATVAALRATVSELITSSGQLQDASSGLESTADGMTAAAEESAEQATQVATAADDVSSAVQNMAASSQELEVSVGEIAHSAAEAAGVAAEAVTAAEAAAENVATLGESSREIGNVLKLITSIAEQTNLLALNATIEAARAGDAGKGFAVVAGEVKELAQETARATDDIAKRIEAIQADTGAAITAIDGIGSVIGRISDYQTVIASAVEEQSITARDLARGVNEASSRSSDIAGNVAAVAGSAGRTRTAAGQAQAASTELSTIAGRLGELVRAYRL